MNRTARHEDHARAAAAAAGTNTSHTQPSSVCNQSERGEYRYCPNQPDRCSTTQHDAPARGHADTERFRGIDAGRVPVRTDRYDERVRA